VGTSSVTERLEVVLTRLELEYVEVRHDKPGNQYVLYFTEDEAVQLCETADSLVEILEGVEKIRDAFREGITEIKKVIKE
jgi:hypothetical protein